MKKFMALGLVFFLAACAAGGNADCQRNKSGALFSESSCAQSKVKEKCPCKVAKPSCDCGSYCKCAQSKVKEKCPCKVAKPSCKCDKPCKCAKKCNCGQRVKPCGACRQAEVDPCRCSYRPDPCRQVLRPRINEQVVEKPRRNCPADGQAINCGCGNCPTFRQPEVVISKVDVFVPAMPEAYVLASNRTVSPFLNGTASLYQQNPNTKLYIRSAKTLSADLPDGVEAGAVNFKKQIDNSYTFKIVDNTAADYYVDITADWLDTPSKNIPAIQYKTALYDKKNNKINEWVEVVKYTNNSQSWL